MKPIEKLKRINMLSMSVFYSYAPADLVQIRSDPFI